MYPRSQCSVWLSSMKCRLPSAYCNFNDLDDAKRAPRLFCPLSSAIQISTRPEKGPLWYGDSGAGAGSFGQCRHEYQALDLDREDGQRGQTIQSNMSRVWKDGNDSTRYNSKTPNHPGNPNDVL